MAFQIYQHPKAISLDANVRALPGSKLNFFLTGTTTPTNTYTTAALSVAHSNPVVANSAGVFETIYLDPSITYKVTYTTSADVLIYTVDPVNDQILSQSVIGELLYPQTDAEVSAGVTPTDYSYPPLNILRYGADPTGFSDSGVAFNALVSVMAETEGGDAHIPPGQYLFTTQPLITGYFTGNASFWCYGAEFYSSGSIFGLSINYNGTPHLLTVYGLTINHRGNADADGGFELSGCNHVKLKNCTVEAHGVGAAYSAYLLHNEDPADTDTGCFWCVLEDCTVRKRSGADVGNIPAGVSIIGASNATTIRGGFYGATCTIGVYIAPESGQTYIANAVLIDGVALEGGTDAIVVNAAASVGISGLRIVNCRCEGYTTFFSLDGATSDGAVPPFLAGNYLVPGVTYLSNTNSLYYVSLDSATSGTRGWNLDLGAAMVLRQTSGTGHTFDLQVPTSAGGAILVRDTAGTEVARIRQGEAVDYARLQGATNGSLEINGIRGLSKTATNCRNFSGSVTFASAATAAVTFGTAEVDGNYLPQISGGANETFWWSARGTGGFTINSSNATSTAVVTWTISR